MIKTPTAKTTLKSEALTLCDDLLTGFARVLVTDGRAVVTAAVERAAAHLRAADVRRLRTLDAG